MANVLVNDSSLADIADAIREKNGTEETYKPAEMGAAIRDIESGGGVDYLAMRCNNTDTFDYYSEDVITLGIGCFAQSKIKRLILPNCTTIGDMACQYTTYLEYIELPSIVYVTGGQHFAGSALKEITLPKLSTNNNVIDARNSKELEKVDITGGKTVTANTFNGCSMLNKFILRRQGAIVPLAATSAFTNTPIANGTGFVYVPKALIETYKAATNWVTYANQFRALEDYTVDGTITGELDESKI